MQTRVFTTLLFAVFTTFAGMAQVPAGAKRDPLLDSIEACDARSEWERSNEFARQWVAKKQADPGTDSLDYAKALVLLSDGLMALGASEEVLVLLDKALAIQTRSLGPNHGDVGRTSSKTGNYYFEREDLKNTEIWWQKALSIREAAFGPVHQDVATSLYNLGLLYEITNFPKSEIYHLRSLEIRKKLFGMDHEDVGNSMQALGNLYANSFGDYGKAEPLFRSALEVQLKILGPEHPYVAYTLNSLGELYQYLGDYIKAEQLTLRSYEILNKAAGPESGETGILINNLGALYQETGDYAKAADYHRKALAMAEKEGLESTRKATSLLNLGIVHNQLGQLALAEKQFREAFQIKSRVLGAQHPSSVFIKSQMLKNYTHIGSYPKAETVGKESLAVLEKTWGPTHPETMNCRNGLGILKWTEGKPKEAQTWFWINNRLNRKALETIFPHLSERGREAFIEKASRLSDYFQSYCTAYSRQNQTFAGALYNHRLAYKGLLLNTSARWKQKAKNSGDTLLMKQLSEWEMIRSRIGNLFTSSDSTLRSGMDSLVEKAEILEKRLSGRLAMATEKDLQQWKLRTWQEVQKRLKPGEAAIEMVRVKKFGTARRVIDSSGLKKKLYRIKDLTDTVYYAALLLRKDSPRPELILFENGNAMEGRWLQGYQNAIRFKLQDQTAYRTYWEPLGKRLKGIRKVWFSADGVYHNINLNTIQNPNSGKYLLDELELQLLTSSRDLLQQKDPQAYENTACLLGNPDFGSNIPSYLTNGTTRSVTQSYYLKPDPDAHLDQLPGTEEEIESIANLLSARGWKVQKLIGKEASEKNLKDQEQPKILVLSTHGFFRPDNTPGHNPLVNSGLLLVGAEKTLRNGRPGEGEDGVLTAYEAMNLNLENTELAVLSACETGLGEIKNGEGVYGLQRAFQVAGAKCLIMSLWKVNDAVTRELMVSFFKEFTSGKSKRDAFLAAQKSVKATYSDPYYWGAFVLVGE